MNKTLKYEQEPLFIAMMLQFGPFDLDTWHTIQVRVAVANLIAAYIPAFAEILEESHKKRTYFAANMHIGDIIRQYQRWCEAQPTE